MSASGSGGAIHAINSAADILLSSFIGNAAANGGAILPLGWKDIPPVVCHSPTARERPPSCMGPERPLVAPANPQAKSKKAVTIKSHHNVGGLPEQLGLKLLEPLRDLFKDEVRELGVALGLPPEMVYRHPFPGPGLGVRILGEVKPEFADLLRRADAIFIEELRNFTDESGKTFGIDHGVTFSAENKLRTVLWGWIGQGFPEQVMQSIGQQVFDTFHQTQFPAKIKMGHRSLE